MRQPTSPAAKWEWWQAACDGLNPPVHDQEPQCGFFAVRRFRYGEWVKGPFVPARIWIEPGETDPETGELLSDERFRAEIDGKPADPWRIWQWVAKRPIPLSEWEFLGAMSPLLPTKIPSRRRSA
jgi:hypothetical protein